MSIVVWGRWFYDFQNELKNLEDASDELALMDDDVKIPYYIGEVFVHQSLEKRSITAVTIKLPTEAIHEYKKIIEEAEDKVIELAERHANRTRPLEQGRAAQR